ncbi:MAG: hypothetical protein KA144_05530, partial [Xanthomonadaceae bacterium]|nr:hypothetical protein [Xanthomonadaceae bacterium]
MATRLIAFSTLACAAAATLTAVFARWLEPWAAAAAAFAIATGFVVVALRRTIAPMRGLFRALAGTVASYRDGDYSFGIRWDQDRDLA